MTRPIRVLVLSLALSFFLSSTTSAFAQFEGLDLSSKKKKKNGAASKTKKGKKGKVKEEEEKGELPPTPPETGSAATSPAAGAAGAKTEGAKPPEGGAGGLGLDLSGDSGAAAKPPAKGKGDKAAPTMSFDAVDVSGKTADRQKLDAALADFKGDNYEKAALGAWELMQDPKMVELHQDKLKYALANKAAEVKFTDLLDKVEKAVVEAQKLSAQVLKDLSGGKTVNVGEHTKTQQDFRGIQRDARDAVTNKGAINQIKFLDEIRKPGLDPKKVELPSAAIKKIEAKLDALETQVDALGEALGQAIEKQAAIAAAGPLADEARKLLEEFKASHKRIKSLSGDGKKLLATAKKTNQTIRASKVSDTSKFLEVIHKLHLVSQKYEEDVLKEAYRGRDAKGELQMKLSAMTKKEGFDIAMNQPFRDWRAAIFDVVRLCTLPGGAAKDEIDDALDYVISFGGTSASQGESQAKRIAEERSALGKKYGSTGA